MVYGICTNTGGKKDGTPCSKCQNKEKQAVRASKEFVCEECGEPLTKVDPPKPKIPKWFYIILVLVVIGIVIAIFVISRNAENPAENPVENPVEKEPDIDQAYLDSIAKAEADSLKAIHARDSIAELKRVLMEKARQDSIDAYKKHNPKNSIDYGKWSGGWNSGKPHGTGRMIYTEEHLIDSRDLQKRVAQKGDYIIGEFYEGKLIQGVWYDASNTVKGSIIIGM